MVTQRKDLEPPNVTAFPNNVPSGSHMVTFQGALAWSSGKTQKAE